MDIKRISLISAFILVSAGIGFLLYIVFFKGPATQTPPTQQPTTQGPTDFPQAGIGGERPTTQPGGGLPVSGETPGVSGITQQPTAPPVIAPPIRQLVSDTIAGANVRPGAVSFYNNIDGQFYTVDAAGQTRQLSDEVFFNVQNINWSPANNEAILEYPDGSNILYNFDSKTQVTLPRHWEEFSFSSQGDRIAAKSIGVSPDNRWLVSTDPDGKNVKLIEPLGENADKVTIDWSPNEQIVGFSRTGAALGAEREEILFVGQNGENFRSMTVEGRGFESEWSTTGNKLLYSVHSARSDFKPELWIVNSTPATIGQNRESLRINTWAHKCTFADDRFVYCGVPEALQTGAGFAPGLANVTNDKIFRIDTQTGAQTEINTSGEQHTIQSMFVDQTTGNLFFTDMNQPGLFQVNI
ncbi:MAG: hypothetical protein COU35_02625 [Candidatus Magasanikbacteria bacterium CG10_big_fil_rev_8_21_14_0_10_47_10]|uniref:Dipeptidylpeptidase IV N-terminal domain-containing protein n=1 Tax=Candidatus Magasanikbacteria bacterium CG10_big_fil_rev_8_21_14_0_10_47_10 TaxID=1974652 RepID=A0A2H0TQN3_9BACT|nr:MAG: hypothetical protein COU35_02625 [Candidatus Magasanikbacteria bacterium CG10_big_fil_rev_8_21_14_0_10_47_10]